MEEIAMPTKRKRVHLTREERAVIRDRFGIGAPERTFEQIVGLDEDSAQGELLKIEASALRKLRNLSLDALSIFRRAG